MAEFAKIKEKKTSGNKKGAKKEEGPDLEGRRSTLQSKEGQNALIFIQNKEVDLNNHENNDNKPFYLAYFNKLDGDNALCNLHEEEVKDCKVASLKAKNFPVRLDLTMEFSQSCRDGVQDMVEIDELNQANLLYNMATRYKRDDIYNYVGPILLALNPFKAVPGLNTEEQLIKYKEIITSSTPMQLKKSMGPHIYAISSIAYRNMKEKRSRQAIVISGESGAGKTESAKIAMNFLTSLGA